MKRAAAFALALLTAVLVSSELALSLPIFGVGPDLVAVAVVAFAAGQRPRVAAVYGFGAGLLRDLLLSTPTGASAFAYALTAYAVSVLGAIRGPWSATGLVAAATFAAHAIYGLWVLLLSEGTPGAPLVRSVVVVTLYNALIAPLVLPVFRRLAAPRAPVGGVSD